MTIGWAVRSLVGKFVILSLIGRAARASIEAETGVVAAGSPAVGTRQSYTMKGTPMSNSARPIALFNLSLFVVFGIAAVIMVPISLRREENWMAGFWGVQSVAMTVGFLRNCRRVK